MGPPSKRSGKSALITRKNIAVEVTDPSQAVTCEFCHQPKLNGNEVEQAGRLYKYWGKYLHFFCVLFSSGIVQGKSDSEGLKGFDNHEIQRALRLGQKTNCCYCSRPGATVDCRSSKCKKTYHFPCGYKADNLFVFHHDMRSFCSKHIPKQTHRVKIDEKLCIAGCLEEIVKHDRVIISPCCGRRYHKGCVQQIAVSSGIHHFKCPACSAKKEFVDVAVACGIYVPIQDASWEADEQFYEFRAQGELYRRCDAKRCLCPRGRQHTVNGTNFELIRCENCGCSAVHIKCGGLLRKAPLYLCHRHDGSELEMARHKVEIRKNPEYSSESESSGGEEPPKEPVKIPIRSRITIPKKSTARKSTGGRDKRELLYFANNDSDEEQANAGIEEYFEEKSKIPRHETHRAKIYTEISASTGKCKPTKAKKKSANGRKPFGLLHPRYKTKLLLKFPSSRPTQVPFGGRKLSSGFPSAVLAITHSDRVAKSCEIASFSSATSKLDVCMQPPAPSFAQSNQPQMQPLNQLFVRGLPELNVPSPIGRAAHTSHRDVPNPTVTEKGLRDCMPDEVTITPPESDIEVQDDGAALPVIGESFSLRRSAPLTEVSVAPDCLHHDGDIVIVN